ncbi:hypothetical protein [Orgyia leucostigma nucleopolyhedrovirus]|uniref:Ac55 n=1 Tax=Orgyia leucostigma nucleopolyhedrovirus TaxID=490711 RepID=B0FDQ5_9ABAC|nr:hypothetical protein [Orgyia leucostigma nucleopolyhedrovirus]ABY65763.1 hypothetical protein [Orgyia leucostigma nucleopolyhedrovirus]
MSQTKEINIKLGRIIDSAIDAKIKTTPMTSSSSTTAAESLALFYVKRKEDSSRVGRSTTYDVVGQRNFKKYFDEKKYKF